MTYLIKCDGCGVIQESIDSQNPINTKTNEKWYSRLNGNKTEHACSRSCIKEGLVSPI